MYYSFPKKKLREFGILIGFFFPFFIGFVLPSLSGHSFRFWTVWLGFTFLFLAILKPSLLSMPYKGWMALGHVLGWINSRIILGLVFLIVLIPIALIMRIIGYDPLRSAKLETESYRELKNKNKNIDLTRIF